MKEQKNQGPSGLSVLFLSWFYTGKFPKAPGTMGSLATIPLIYGLHYWQTSLWSLIAIIIILYTVSVIITQKIQIAHGLKDPQWIVIDEVIGMLITWAFVMEVEFHTLFLVFGTFRFFDIVKIWPASYFDKMNHGIGTITDDVISGFYAGGVTLLISHFL